jgi:hypothetical protein
MNPAALVIRVTSPMSNHLITHYYCAIIYLLFIITPFIIYYIRYRRIWVYRACLPT